MEVTLLLLEVEVLAPVFKLGILQLSNVEIGPLDGLLEVPAAVDILLRASIGFVVVCMDLLAKLSLNLEWCFLNALVLERHGTLDGLERFGVYKLLDWPRTDENGEFLVVPRELVNGEPHDTTIYFGGIGGFLRAIFELDVLVPERVALEVKANKVGTALEQPAMSVSPREERGGGRGGGQSP